MSTLAKKVSDKIVRGSSGFLRQALLGAMLTFGTPAPQATAAQLPKIELQVADAIGEAVANQIKEGQIRKVGAAAKIIDAFGQTGDDGDIEKVAQETKEAQVAEEETAEMPAVTESDTAQTQTENVQDAGSSDTAEQTPEKKSQQTGTSPQNSPNPQAENPKQTKPKQATAPETPNDAQQTKPARPKGSSSRWGADQWQQMADSIPDEGEEGEEEQRGEEEGGEASGDAPDASTAPPLAETPNAETSEEKKRAEQLMKDKVKADQSKGVSATPPASTSPAADGSKKTGASAEQNEGEKKKKLSAKKIQGKIKKLEKKEQKLDQDIARAEKKVEKAVQPLKRQRSVLATRKRMYQSLYNLIVFVTVLLVISIVGIIVLLFTWEIIFPVAMRLKARLVAFTYEIDQLDEQIKDVTETVKRALGLEKNKEERQNIAKEKQGLMAQMNQAHA